ncbi:hypothetical protein [Variovorax sp. J31P207]|uniref:hypothetical protein n=1 Tax=Variovorax sp. J31P207 TaxID=3053510 RepID=UPI0025770A07|nr:hypothetical protein [Variovorax sp. J31P207]MDM0065306.1 hypothetical protein [Variovorax sp. J31P207]
MIGPAAVETDNDQWQLSGALDAIRDIDRISPDRSFAFILGAGASVGSGIPSGQSMADTWIREIHKQQAPSDVPFEQWIAEGGCGIEGLTETNLAEHYPTIFEKRFGKDQDEGYARLEALMDGKQPSLGYSLLAEIMNQTRHRTVVTTNFDNLVVDALSMHAHKPPLIVGHESLTGFIRQRQRRPLVAKIHRDLFLAPISNPGGVSTLGTGWQEALCKLFKEHTPIVVGYGGNDGSLMGFLEALTPADVVGRMIWCFRAGSLPNDVARRVVKQLNGVLVPITTFDDFMLRLAGSLIEDFDLARVSNRLERLGRTRAERYRAQAEEIRRRAVLEAAGTADERTNADDGESTTGRIMDDALRDDSIWWTWDMRAKARLGFDERNAVYQEGLEHLLGHADLLLSYAQMLERANKRDDAKVQYLRAIEARPDDAVILQSYATFLLKEIGGLDEAEKIYQKSLRLDPHNARSLGKYAEFLAYCRDERDAAKRYFKEALELEPTNAAITRDYATFLITKMHDRAEAQSKYVAALKLNPDDPLTIGNLAYFKERELGKDDEAEGLYRKALGIDAMLPLNLVNFGNFLARKRGRSEEAEDVYRKLLTLTPGHSSNVGAYVDLLLNGKTPNDVAGAARVLAEALAHEPDNPNNVVNLAAVQLCGGSLDEARASARKAIALAEPKTSQIVAEALVYESLIAESRNLPVEPALSRLNHLLSKGYERMPWGFKAVMDVALAGATPERRNFFDLVASAVLEKKGVAALALHTGWKDIKPVDPTTPLSS